MVDTVVPFDKILVPLDGSTLADSTVLALRTSLRPMFKELVLVTALGEDPGEVAITDAQVYVGHAELVVAFEHRMKRVAAELAAVGITGTTRVMTRTPFDAVSRSIADDPSIGAVALTTHGRWGFGQRRLGQVAERVLRGGSTPLLFIPPGYQPPTGDDGEPRPVRRILVPIDSNKDAWGINVHVHALAQLYQAHVDLVYVDRTIRATPMSDFERRVLLEAAGAEFGKTGLHVEALHRVGWNVESQVDSAVTERQSDLVVMATHGRAALFRWLLGSHAESLLRRLRVPVLVVRIG